jgi:hypothetical protein
MYVLNSCNARGGNLLPIQALGRGHSRRIPHDTDDFGRRIIKKSGNVRCRLTRSRLCNGIWFKPFRMFEQPSRARWRLFIWPFRSGETPERLTRKLTNSRRRRWLKWPQSLEKPKRSPEYLFRWDVGSRQTRACTHKSRTLTDLAMSALPSEAEIRASFRHVCFGPLADMREQICANRKTAQQRSSEIPSRFNKKTPS